MRHLKSKAPSHADLATVAVGHKKQKTLAWQPYHVAEKQLVFKVGNLSMEEDTFRKPQTDFFASIVDQLGR